jgi:hypothetical protein
MVISILLKNRFLKYEITLVRQEVIDNGVTVYFRKDALYNLLLIEFNYFIFIR